MGDDEVRVPEPGFADLFGVPVEVLDAAATLRRAALARELTLRQWRRRHRALLGDYPTPDPDQVAALHQAVLQEWLGELRAAREQRLAAAAAEDTWRGAGEPEPQAPDDRATSADRKRHLERLMSLLEVFDGPPTAAQIAEFLDSTLAEQRTRVAKMTGSARADGLAVLAEDERRYRAWRLEGDRVARDPGTGLPLTVLEEYRHLDHPVLGRVPVGLGEARAAAWLAATPEQRRDADAAIDGRGFGVDDDRSVSMQRLQRQLPRELLTGFLAWVRGQDDEAAAELAVAWDRGRLRDLLGRYLDEQT